MIRHCLAGRGLNDTTRSKDLDRRCVIGFAAKRLKNIAQAFRAGSGARNTRPESGARKFCAQGFNDMDVAFNHSRAAFRAPLV